MTDRTPASQRRLRVCHVITGFDTGGAERILMQTVRGLDPTRFESLIVSLRAPGLLSGSAESLGVEVVHLDMWRRPGPVTLWRLGSTLRRKRVDIVHAYLYDASVAARLIGRLAGVPVVLTSTRASLGYLPPLAWWVDRQTARWCDRVIAVSLATARFIVETEGLPAEKVVVVPNGVDLDRFRPEPPEPGRRALDIPSDAFVIACVGRLHAHKGHRYLLDALVTLRRQVPNLVCLIAGEGPDRAALEERVASLGLADVCRFLGSVDRIETIYSAADVTVLPSLFEGMPNTVLEAMAMARPVVATAVDGSVELVRPDETGLLVPPGDPAALSDALTAIALDKPRGTRLGMRARAVAEQEHGIDRTVARLEAIYMSEWTRAAERRHRRSNLPPRGKQ